MDGKASCTPGAAGGSCCACCTPPAAPCCRKMHQHHPICNAYVRMHACVRVCVHACVHVHPCTLLPAGRPRALLLCSQAWHCLNAANITQMGSAGLNPQPGCRARLNPLQPGGGSGFFPSPSVPPGISRAGISPACCCSLEGKALLLRLPSSLSLLCLLSLSGICSSIPPSVFHSLKHDNPQQAERVQ